MYWQDTNKDLVIFTFVTPFVSLNGPVLIAYDTILNKNLSKKIKTYIKLYSLFLRSELRTACICPEYFTGLCLDLLSIAYFDKLFLHHFITMIKINCDIVGI